jgi:hypothetical protein
MKNLHKLFSFLKIQQSDQKEDHATQDQEDTTFDDDVLPNHGMNVGRYFERIEKYVPE